MKRVVLSLSAIVAMSSMVFAGGDIAPVEAVPVVVEETGENNFYLGIALSAVSNRAKSTNLNFLNIKDDQDRTGNVTLLAGYNFDAYTEYLAIEGRYTTSVTDEDIVKMSGWSIFLKPKYTFKDDNGEKSDFTVYGLLGYGGVDIDGRHNYLIDVDDSDFQWGLGASYSMKQFLNGSDISIFADYTMLADGMNGWTGIAMPGQVHVRPRDADVDAFTLGFIYKF